MTVQQWRNKHRRCAWCIYCEKRSGIDVDAGGFVFEVVRHYCTAKLKTVDSTLPRPFCRLFNQRKDD